MRRRHRRCTLTIDCSYISSDTCSNTCYAGLCILLLSIPDFPQSSNLCLWTIAWIRRFSEVWIHFMKEYMSFLLSTLKPSKPLLTNIADMLPDFEKPPGHIIVVNWDPGHSIINLLQNCILMLYFIHKVYTQWMLICLSGKDLRKLYSRDSY